MDETLKFTFDTAFGTKSDGQDVAAAITVITQDDVDAARTKGFVEGREDGLNEICEQTQLDFENSIKQVSQKLGLIFNAQTKAHQEALENSRNLALLIAKKVAKAALDQYPTQQVKKLIDDCLSHNSTLPHLLVRVNQAVHQRTQDELQPIFTQKGYEGKIMILGDENIRVGDCMIEWNDGGVTHNTDIIIEKIDNILKEYFSLDAENISAQTQDVLEGNEDE